MTDMFFDLNGKPYRGEDWLEQWMADQKKPERLLCQTTLKNKFFVSTIWLGFDVTYTAFGLEPRPWESMVFDPKGNPCRQERYSSKEEALGGHLLLCVEFETCVFIDSPEEE